MMQSSVRDSSTAHPRSFQPPKDPMWSALIEDTNIPVVVVDTAGTIEFANPVAARVMGVDPGAAAGRHMRDFFSQEWVAERMGLIRDAATSGRPVTVEGMVKGRMM